MRRKILCYWSHRLSQITVFIAIIYSYCYIFCYHVSIVFICSYPHVISVSWYLDHFLRSARVDHGHVPILSEAPSLGIYTLQEIICGFDVCVKRYYIILYYIILDHITLQHIILHYIILCYIILYTLLSYSVFHYII